MAEKTIKTHVGHLLAKLGVADRTQAALLALTRGAAGVYNIAEPDGAVTIDKAQRELGFNPAFRLSN